MPQTKNNKDELQRQLQQLQAQKKAKSRTEASPKVFLAKMNPDQETIKSQVPDSEFMSLMGVFISNASSSEVDQLSQYLNRLKHSPTPTNRRVYGLASYALMQAKVRLTHLNKKTHDDATENRKTYLEQEQRRLELQKLHQKSSESSGVMGKLTSALEAIGVESKGQNPGIALLKKIKDFVTEKFLGGLGGASGKTVATEHEMLTKMTPNITIGITISLSSAFGGLGIFPAVLITITLINAIQLIKRESAGHGNLARMALDSIEFNSAVQEVLKLIIEFSESNDVTVEMTPEQEEEFLQCLTDLQSSLSYDELQMVQEFQASLLEETAKRLEEQKSGSNFETKPTPPPKNTDTPQRQAPAVY